MYRSHAPDRDPDDPEEPRSDGGGFELTSEKPRPVVRAEYYRRENIREERYTCDECDADPFGTYNALIRHMAAEHDSHPSREQLQCPECGDTFSVPECRVDDRTYCSRECSVEAQRDRVELTCAECGEAFRVPRSRSDRKYCSKDCSTAAKKGTNPFA